MKERQKTVTNGMFYQADILCCFEVTMHSTISDHLFMLISMCQKTVYKNLSGQVMKCFALKNISLS
jgi:hypothetical protein